jgi:hypothetical protein
MATQALHAGYNRLLWIDSDIQFSLGDVVRLAEWNLPLVGGIYPVKGERRLACCPLKEVDEIHFGEGGGVMEVKYLATGFLLTHASVYAAIRAKYALPVCHDGSVEGLIPFFVHELTRTEDGKCLFLSEGFSFCEKARSAGFGVFADTRIRLGHVGKYVYGWEDAGSDPARYQTYRYNIDSRGNDG